MHFVSQTFLVFALAFAAPFFFLGRTGQKLLLVGAGLYFCGSQSVTFALILAASIFVNSAVAGLIVPRAEGLSRAMWLGIVANLALLGVFKYFNFFASASQQALAQLGMHYTPPIMAIVAPLGLSFYTLQAIGYLVDLRDGRVERASLLDTAVFLSFWPKFVAGPVIRARRFLPQLKRARRFRWANCFLGLESIVYGLFLKTVLSDFLAPTVDRVYAAPHAFDGASSLIATLFFSFQIYGDFAGYSLVVIGIARILGYSIAVNFRRPNFARSFSDFWSRWHISLSSWLEEYVFRRLRPRPAADAAWTPGSVGEIFADILGDTTGASFGSLGADSLSYVQVAMALETYLGALPEGWEAMSVAQLEELKGVTPCDVVAAA